MNKMMMPIFSSTQVLLWDRIRHPRPQMSSEREQFFVPKISRLTARLRARAPALPEELELSPRING